MKKITKKTKKNKKHHRSLNNIGMSLVEVVIAMTILSVVVVAVVQSLTMAMVYNKKARMKQDATIKGESIMELFKGYNMDELYDKFADTEDNALKQMIGSGSYDATKESTSGILTFTIDDLVVKSTDAGAGEKYDVKVVATPVPSIKLFETQKFDDTKDAVWISDESYDEGVRDRIFNAITDPSDEAYLLDDFVTALNAKETIGGTTYACDDEGKDITESNVKLQKDDIFLSERNTVFTIDDGGVGVKMTYKYRIYGFKYYEKVFPVEPTDTYGTDEYEESSTEPAPTETPEALPGELKYFDYPAADAEEDEIPKYEVSLTSNDHVDLDMTTRERLFIYYFPQYEERNRVKSDGRIETVQIADKIEIQDTRTDKSEPVECFIIKQRRSGLTDANLNVREERYTLSSLTASSSLRVYDNFSENISTGETNLAGVTGSDFYMKDDTKKDNIVAYKLELTMTRDGTSTVVTNLVSSSNER